METDDVGRLGLPEPEGHYERTEGAAGHARQESAARHGPPDLRDRVKPLSFHGCLPRNDVDRCKSCLRGRLPRITRPNVERRAWNVTRRTR